jgi:hypothetical protein
MKKVLYSVLAVMVMSLCLVSCKDSKAPADKENAEAAAEEKVEEKAAEKAAIVVDENANPVEKLVGIMSGVVNVLKDTHIKSADDLVALQKKLEGVKDQVEAATTDLASFFSSVTAENAEKIQATMGDLQQRMDQLEKDGEAEVDRLEKEAEALGLNLDGLDDIF